MMMMIIIIIIMIIVRQHTSDAERQETTHEATRTTAADDETRQQNVSSVGRVSLLYPLHSAEPRPPSCNKHLRSTLGRDRVKRARSAAVRAWRFLVSCGARVRCRPVLILRRRSCRVEVVRWITGALEFVDTGIWRRRVIHRA